MHQIVSKCGNWRLYGNPESNVLISGHSHTFAMYMAVIQNRLPNVKVAVASHANFDHQVQPDESYWNFVAEVSKMRNLALSWNGNQHNLLFLLDAGWKFNSIGLNLGKNYPFVTLKRIAALFDKTFSELELVLAKFHESTKICLLGTPQPKPIGFLKKHLDKDVFFTQQAKLLGLNQNNLKISSDEIRLFMWKLNQELMENLALKYRIGFLPAPKEATNSSGLLAEIFSSDDLTHANPEYGRLMLEKISNFFEAIYE